MSKLTHKVLALQLACADPLGEQRVIFVPIALHLLAALTGLCRGRRAGLVVPGKHARGGGERGRVKLVSESG